VQPYCSTRGNAVEISTYDTYVIKDTGRTGDLGIVNEIKVVLEFVIASCNHASMYLLPDLLSMTGDCATIGSILPGTKAATILHILSRVPRS